MADQKHLDLLSAGKTRWKTWRQAFPDGEDVEPDLHGADLRGVDHHRADLSEANLQKVDLREADLHEAD